jgi:hypothetical protein
MRCHVIVAVSTARFFGAQPCRTKKRQNYSSVAPPRATATGSIRRSSNSPNPNARHLRPFPARSLARCLPSRTVALCRVERAQRRSRSAPTGKPQSSRHPPNPTPTQPLLNSARAVAVTPAGRLLSSPSHLHDDRNGYSLPYQHHYRCRAIITPLRVAN